MAASTARGWSETLFFGLCVLLLLAHFSLVLKPRDALTAEPFTDDSFYAFTIADNLARGDGITIDGRMNTNGFQPLVVLLYALVFKLFGGDLFLQLRLVHLVGACLACLSGVMLYRFCVGGMADYREKRLISLVAAVIWLGACPILMYQMNGLETGLYFVAILGCLEAYRRLRSSARPSGRHAVGFGMLLGLTVLVRVDAVFLVGAFAIVHCWRSRHSLGRAAAQAASFATVAAIVSSPWWIYNVAYFGSLMPTSGHAEAAASGTLAYSPMRNLNALLPGLNTLLYPFTYLPGKRLMEGYFPGGGLGYSIVTTGVLSAVVLAAVRSWHRKRASDGGRDGVDDSGSQNILGTPLVADLAPVAIHAGVLFTYYIFFFAAAHYILRYLAPAYVLTVPASAALVVGIVRRLCGGRERLAAGGIAGIGVLLTVGLWLFVGSLFSVQSTYYLDQWGWVEDNLAGRDAKVGAAQTGTLGYFWRSAVNLDGKVNYEALHALEEGGIGNYIIDKDIEYLIDWPINLEGNFLAAPEMASKFVEIDRRGQFGIFRRRDKQPDSGV